MMSVALSFSGAANKETEPEVCMRRQRKSISGHSEPCALDAEQWLGAGKHCL